MLAGGERVVFLDDDRAIHHVLVEELADHLAGLLCADNLGVRIAAEKIHQRGGVIRFHVLHDHIVKLPPVERVRHVFKKDLAERFVHGIKQDRLLV